MSIIKYSWRITKYNPEFRSNYDEYLMNEWTSFTDIENNGQGLKFREYLAIESMYINVISKFMDFLNVENLTVIDLEKREIENLETAEIYAYKFPFIRTNNYLYQFLKEIKESKELPYNKVRSLSRLILREIVWCKLVSQPKLFVHFGFDYYMYIGSNEDCTPVINWIKEKTELFVEEYTSPYIEEDF